MKAQTFLPLFSGFYGSHWDSVDFYGEEEYFSLPEGDEFWDEPWGRRRSRNSRAYSLSHRASLGRRLEFFSSFDTNQGRH